MTSYVVDASVAAGALLPEETSTACATFLAEKRELLAPDTLYLDVVNAMWKRWCRGELEPGHVERGIDWLRNLELTVFESSGLMTHAFELAEATRQPVYDCAYLSMAILMNAPLVTADKKLVQTADKNGLSEHVVWVEDVT